MRPVNNYLLYSYIQVPIIKNRPMQAIPAYSGLEFIAQNIVGAPISSAGNQAIYTAS
jgi:hypothetical protein